MGKNIKIKITILAVFILLMPFLVFSQNYVSLVGIISFQLYTIGSGPVLTSLVAGSTTPPWQQVTNLNVQTNYIDITLDNASLITLNTTSAGQYLQVSKVSGSNDYTISPTCITSQATLTGTGSTVTLRVEVTKILPACATPITGGGGGGGTSHIFPTDYFVIINNGAECTQTSEVVLNLSAKNATQVIISNRPNFLGNVWEPFDGYINKSWILESGDDWRTVYVMFKSSTGDLSSVISDSILVSSDGCDISPPPPPPEEEPVPPGGAPGCAVIDCNKVTYNLYIVNPDGFTRDMNSNYARVESINGDIKVIGFEDSGSDFDYNDLKFLVDQKECDKIVISFLELNASWHHEIRMILYYNGIRNRDLLIWPDSQLAVGERKIIDVAETLYCVSEDAKIYPGDLIKGSLDAVYYYGNDGKRHVFTSRGVYDSYYNGDFSMVKKITDEQLSKISLGYNMTYNPGAKMIKIQSDPKVYAVAPGAILRWVTTESIAQQLYGASWSAYIDDVNVAFWVDYEIGDPIYLAGEYPASLLPDISSAPPATSPQSSEDIIPAPDIIEPSDCTSDYTFVSFLALESLGDEVRALQELLKCLGYFPADQDPTSYFGPVTEEAVRKFQAAKGIDVVGYVGPQTRDALNNY